ncbi:NAD(P)-binding protein [Massarina eburnea CBS 473.64]|uniref:NAD(P)-binding protein n=1 Tax=Massarina eburnea CBS 473.64 TaxID=1395130 RepID=A0A6A6S069_9PLEO|nr:NAD(P)-binding protein [Massarina eburnea CBS 473.64]
MSHNILITGGSGYLGGSLLAGLKGANLPPYSTLYALVRTDDQAKAVRQYAAEPLQINLSSPESITSTIINKQITIVFHLYDAIDIDNPSTFIKALSQVKQATGQEVHFLYTTGAKLFSEFAGAPTDKPLLDTDAELYAIQKKQVDTAPIPFMSQGVQANNLVIEEAEKNGVRAYIFAPCIVYGKGTGFGNKISIQTVGIVRIAKAVRKVYDLNEGKPTWPVCHIDDNTSLYVEILRAALQDRDIGHGKQGYYLASSGSVAWADIYEAMGKTLKERGAVDVEGVHVGPSVEEMGKMGEALGSPPELVRWATGGACTLTAENGAKIGWKAKYPKEHVLEFADAEVDWILTNLGK